MPLVFYVPYMTYFFSLFRKTSFLASFICILLLCQSQEHFPYHNSTTVFPTHTCLSFLYLPFVNWKLIKILFPLNMETRLYGMLYMLPDKIQYLPTIDRAGIISYSSRNLLKHVPQFSHLSIHQVIFIDDLLTSVV